MQTCNKCSLSSSAKQVVPDKGSASASILAFLEAPGSEENEKGIPVCGASGSILHNAMNDAGLNRKFWQKKHYKPFPNEWAFEYATKYGRAKLVYCYENLRIDNICRCQPPNNRDPLPEEIKACSGHIDELIELYKPKIILAIGEIALRFFTGLKKITSFRGYPFYYNDILTIPMLHPAFIMRQRGFYSVLVNDLLKAKRLCETGWKMPKTNYRNARELLTDTIIRNLSEEFALDIETVGVDEESGLDPRLGKITGLACSPHKGFAIHFDYGDFYEKQLAERILNQTEAKITIQNAPFDVTFLKYNNIDIKCSFDTQAAQYLLAPHLPKALEFLNSFHTDYPHYKGQRVKLLKGTLTNSERIEYCCMDADTTLQCKKELEKELTEENLLKPFHEIVMPILNIIPKMHQKGIKVDTKILNERCDEIKTDAERMSDLFESYGINIRSKPQIRKLFTDLKLPDIKSQAKDKLEAYLKKHKHKIIQAVWDYNKTFTQIKFYKGLIKRVSNERLFTRWSATATETGRLGSYDPNLQNINENHRDIFIPDEGMKFLQADYSRIELRIPPILSGDELMYEDVWTRNIHKEIATSVFGENYTNEQYTNGKGITFGVLYGRSAQSIAIEFGVTKKRGQQYIDVLLNRYPKLKAWRERVWKEAEKTGRLRTVFNRIRYFNVGNVKSQAYNFPIQSAAADVLLTSFIKLWEKVDKMDGVDILLTVYDSVLIQYEPELESYVISVCKKHLERKISELDNVSFPVDIKTGWNWKDLKEIK